MIRFDRNLVDLHLFFHIHGMNFLESHSLQVVFTVCIDEQYTNYIRCRANVWSPGQLSLSSSQFSLVLRPC
jgi:hypothetical protein